MEEGILLVWRKALHYIGRHFMIIFLLIFILFQFKNTATQFLHYLNNCHANIKFTVEFEENKQHNPFLGHSYQTGQSHFLNIYLPKEDHYRPVHKMGLLHT